MAEDSALRRTLVYLGLAHPSDGGPREEGRGRSRYSGGSWVSRRLDEDVDELRARVETLERRLGQDPPDRPR